MTKNEQIAALRTALENPTEAMLDAGERAIDDYYNGTKDAPFRGSMAVCMKAMLQAALAAAPAQPRGETLTDLWQRAKGNDK